MSNLETSLRRVVQASLHHAPEQMLQECLGILIATSGATGGSILGEEGAGLVFLYSDVPDLIGVHVPWESIAGNTVSRNKLIYTYAPKDKRHFDGIDEKLAKATRYLFSVPIPSVRNARLQAGAPARACGAVQLLLDENIFPEFNVDDGAVEFDLDEIRDHDVYEERLADVFLVLANIAMGMEIMTLRSTSYEVIHELKNKLIGIRSWANALREDMEELAPEALEEEDIMEDVNLITEPAEAGSKLAVEYLQFTKVYNCTFEEIDVSDLLRATARDLAAFANETGGDGAVQVAVELSDEIPLRQLDPDKIRMAFFNLGKNAAEALIEHGVENATITLRAQHTGARTHIMISDNGGGMPPEIAHNLFKAFATKKSGGTGLGLTIVKKIIDVHGGIIRCDTGPDGTTFTIEL
jgi:signal transduction histidine kinase